MRKQNKDTCKTIPNFICKSPEFKRLHSVYASFCDLDSLPDALRHETHKAIIGAAAAKIRNKMHADKQDATEVKIISVAALARVVLYNRTSLAKKLIGQSDLAARHLVCDGCRVHLADPIAFDSEMAMVKIRNYDEQKADIERLLHAKPCDALKKKLQSIHDQSKLWKVGARRTVLSAIRRADGSLTAGHDEMVQQLRIDWAPKFCAKIDKADQRAAFDELEPFVPAVPELWETIEPLSQDDLRHFAAKAKPTMPGGDGIPYSAWNCSHGASTLQAYAFALFGGLFFNLEWNFNLAAFLPKGKLAQDDAGEVIRLGGQVRPLGMKNSDNKIIGGAFNVKLDVIISGCVDRAQNGFCKGRNPFNNVIALDSGLRLVSFPSNWTNMPCLPAFDFEAAFPSVDHEYIFWILERMQCPEDIFAFLCSFYFFVVAFIDSLKGHVEFLRFESGIIQGCPLSGSIFALSINPILVMMKTNLVEAATNDSAPVLPNARECHDSCFLLRACADDLGAVLGKLRYLKALYNPFQIAAAAAGLRLNLKKCVLIMGEPVNMRLLNRVKDWLTHSCPGWEKFDITNKGKYLGFWLGPSATCFDNFKEPFNELLRRTLAIASAPASSGQAVKAFNRDAVTVISYQMQAFEIPKAISTRQHSFTAKILKTPFAKLGNYIFRTRETLGIPAIVHLESLAEAVRLRTAHKTTKQWIPWHDELCRQFESEAVLASVRGGENSAWKCPSHFSTKPVAQFLAETRILDSFDAHYSATIFAGMNMTKAGFIRRNISEGKVDQRLFYAAAIANLPDSDLTEAISNPKKRLRHIAEPNDCSTKQLCNEVISLWPLICSTLKKCSDKFGVFQIIRFIFNAETDPKNFQQSRKCPFCDDNSSEFALGHLVVCDGFNWFILNCLHESEKGVINEEWIENPSNLLLKCLILLPGANKNARRVCVRLFSLMHLAISAARHNARANVGTLRSIISCIQSY